MAAFWDIFQEWFLWVGPNHWWRPDRKGCPTGWIYPSKVSKTSNIFFLLSEYKYFSAVYQEILDVYSICAFPFFSSSKHFLLHFWQWTLLLKNIILNFSFALVLSFWYWNCNPNVLCSFNHNNNEQLHSSLHLPIHDTLIHNMSDILVMLFAERLVFVFLFSSFLF